MKKIVLLLLTTTAILQAACAYVDCTATVSSLTSQSQQEMQSEFETIQTELNTLEQNYKQYSEVLKENNTLYEKNKELKIQYLILLKKINQKIEALKRINLIEQGGQLDKEGYRCH